MPRHHLAVLWPAYLAMILRGDKRMECRLSRNRRPPYGRVSPGDFLWLKQANGPVLGQVRVAKVSYQHIGASVALDTIRRQYNHMICAEPSFWAQRQDSRFCTLLWLEQPLPTGPIPVCKGDRRAWIVLDGPPAWSRPRPAAPSGR